MDNSDLPVEQWGRQAFFGKFLILLANLSFRYCSESLLPMTHYSCSNRWLRLRTCWGVAPINCRQARMSADDEAEVGGFHGHPGLRLA